MKGTTMLLDLACLLSTVHRSFYSASVDDYTNATVEVDRLAALCGLTINDLACILVIRD